MNVFLSFLFVYRTEASNAPPPPSSLQYFHTLKTSNRVWDLVTGAQRYQFSSPEDRPTCVAYAPSKNHHDEELQSAGGGGGATPGGGVGAVGDEERHLLAGYVSGAMRVFDVPSTSTLFELQQHRSAVQQVWFGLRARARVCVDTCFKISLYIHIIWESRLKRRG